MAPSSVPVVNTSVMSNVVSLIGLLRARMSLSLCYVSSESAIDVGLLVAWIVIMSSTKLLAPRPVVRSAGQRIGG